MTIINKDSFRLALAKAAIVLGPSYSAAWLTDKMVYVVPTLAAASFFAATIVLDDQAIRRNVDDADGQDDTDETDGAEVSVFEETGA